MTSTTVSPPTRLGFDDLPDLLALLRSDAKHDPSAASTLDVHWVLYDRVLNVTPETAGDPERDRLLLSKGHGPASYYAVLAAKGFVPVAELAGFGGFDSRLGHHPDAALIAGVEIASGSLGHGLPIAVGRALALRATGQDGPRVICVLGDGELAEGSNHEAIVLAGRMGLDRLTAIVVDNFSATYGWPDGIATRFESEGWTTASAHARDHDALEQAIAAAGPGRPHAVVALVEA
jgi:transketolase